jgi:hypothetical protein
MGIGLRGSHEGSAKPLTEGSAKGAQPICWGLHWPPDWFRPSVKGVWRQEHCRVTAVTIGARPLDGIDLSRKTMHPAVGALALIALSDRQPLFNDSKP